MLTQKALVLLAVGPPRGEIDSPRPRAERHSVVTQLRRSLLSTTSHVERLQKDLDTLLHNSKVAGSSRSTYLQSLASLVGPPPDRSWQDEWETLSFEYATQAGIHPDAIPLHQDRQRFAARSNVPRAMQQLIAAGWPSEDAEVCVMLMSRASAIGAAARERSPRFAASTYALSRALSRARDHAAPTADAPLTLYALLHRLETLDPSWEELEVPDQHGFRGVCSAAPTQAGCSPERFSEAGGDFDWVGFVSAPDDALGAHSAVTTAHLRPTLSV
jgi:hypothetical protein